MANREAGIRITLDNSAFLRKMEAIGEKARAIGSSIKSGLSAGFKGVGGDALKGGVASVKELTGSLKSAIGSAATLGGGIGFGMLMNKASNLREKVRDIEFQINKTGRATATWQGVMEDVNAASAATGKSSAEMADIYQGLFASTGDAEFAKKALIPIGHAATASGQDVMQLANAAQMLQRKFGATAETLPEMLAAFVEKTDAGGLSLDALGNKFALMAGEAAEAGFTGKDGLNQLLGMMTQLDSRVGEKSEPAMKKLFQVLKDGSKDLKAFSKESGLKFAPDMSAMEKIRKIMGSEKGRAKMAEKLGGESRVVFDELSKPFDAAFAQAKASGAKTKDATAAGLAAWDKAMADMGKATIDYKRLVDESKQGQAEDPQARLNMAIEKISQKFTEPKMMNALDRLAETLPRVAEGAVELIDFVTENPLLSGAALVGGKFLSGAASAGAGRLVGNVGGSVAGALSGQGTKWASEFSGSVKSSGWAGTAGKALGVAAAGVIAFEITRALVDARVEEKAANQKGSVEAGVAAHGARASGNVAQMQAAKAALEANIAKLKEEQSGFGGAFDTFMGGLVTVMPGGDENYVDPNVKALSNAQLELAKLNEALAATTQKLQGAGKATEQMADATKKAGQAAGGAANAFFSVGGSVPTDTTGAGVSKGPGGVANPTKPGYFG